MGLRPTPPAGMSRKSSPFCQALQPCVRSLAPPSLPRPQLNATANTRGSLDFFLSFPITAIKTSLMTLTVAADDVQFVVSRSPASIEAVQAGPPWPAAPALPAARAGLALCV